MTKIDEFPTFVEFQKANIEQSIPAYFEKQVERYAGRIAVQTERQTLTYAELNRAANRVARAILGARGTGEEPVAILLAQGPLPIVALLGILKAGYAALNPTALNIRSCKSVRTSQSEGQSWFPPVRLRGL